MAPASTSRRRRPPEEHVGVDTDPPQKQNEKTQGNNVSQPKATCTNPDCPKPKPVELDGERVCETCGSIISDDNIVAEVTFGETSTGAAVVQGAYVGEGQRHAKTLGGAINRKVGGGLSSREQTLQHFQREIARIASSLGLQQSVKDGAFNFTKLALIYNFTHARATSTVAAVALYMACRTDKENNTLLMDLAEAVKTNVFRLGQTYQALAKMLYMDGGIKKDDVTPFIEVERLILKYARRLEFGVHTYKVAEDAAKIIKRMKRDWMVTGRRPAGLCGAGLVLAARMNNFRRTVREVVYVVKVADMTITKRLDEFDRTTSGGLTVDQFRQYGANLKISHDPPALFDSNIREERKREKRERKRKASLLGDAEGEEEQGPTSVLDRALLGRTTSRSVSATPSRASTSTAAPTQQPRRDAEGFVIPALPLDPRLRDESAQDSSAILTPQDSAEHSASTGNPSGGDRKRRRTVDPQDTQRSNFTSHSDSENTSGVITHDGTAEGSAEPEKKRKRRFLRPRDRHPPVQITAQDLVGEEELENEINRHLHDADFLESMEEVKFLKYESNAKRLAQSLKPAAEVPTSEIIEENEFADDPEVSNCLLNEDEMVIKERIWVTHNEDWLRTQQERILKKALTEASGKNQQKKPRKKRTYRRGDGSSVTDGGTPAESPAEASQRMLNRYGRKGFSKHINYERLNQIYRGGSGKRSGSSQTSASSPAAATSRAQSETSDSETGTQAASRATSPSGSVVSTSSTMTSQRGRRPRSDAGGGEEAQATAGAAAEKQVMVIQDDEEIPEDIDVDQELEEELMDDDDVESMVQDIGEDLEDLSQFAEDDDY